MNRREKQHREFTMEAFAKDVFAMEEAIRRLVVKAVDNGLSPVLVRSFLSGRFSVTLRYLGAIIESIESEKGGHMNHREIHPDFDLLPDELNEEGEILLPMSDTQELTYLKEFTIPLTG